MLLALELQPLFWFYPEIRAAEAAAAAAVVVVLVYNGKVLRIAAAYTHCCCFTHSHLHRRGHYNQQSGKGRHDYPPTM